MFKPANIALLHAKHENPAFNRKRWWRESNPCVAVLQTAAFPLRHTTIILHLSLAACDQATKKLRALWLGACHTSSWDKKRQRGIVQHLSTICVPEVEQLVQHDSRIFNITFKQALLTLQLAVSYSSTPFFVCARAFCKFVNLRIMLPWTAFRI